MIVYDGRLMEIEMEIQMAVQEENDAVTHVAWSVIVPSPNQPLNPQTSFNALS